MTRDRPQRSVFFPVGVLALCGWWSGCEALSPRQLWKLNRQPNLERGDAYFSIPAELGEDVTEGDVVSHLEAPPTAL